MPAFCTQEAIDIYNKHCKPKQIKAGQHMIDHVPIHEVLIAIEYALEQSKTDQDLTGDYNIVIKPPFKSKAN